MRGSFFFGFFLGYAVGTAGGFFLSQNKRKIQAKLWMWRARMEIERRLRELGEFSRSTYDEIVEEVLERYRERGTIAMHKLDAFEDELKRRYGQMKRRFTAILEDPDDDEEDDKD